MKNIIITGGAGFIGSNFLKKFSKYTYNRITIDSLTYASNISYLDDLSNNKNYNFFKINILDEYNVKKILTKFNPQFIFNFAAESHVDNSIKDSSKFLETNILGTHALLKVILDVNSKLDKNFKFIQISTDEVFGDISKNKRKSLESDPYVTSSPYSASKASADHLVTAWGRTYKIPYNITYSCNNFGPNQNKEKFIPVIINNIMSRKKIPLYGNGHQIRDWIYVEDNVEAIMRVALKGKLNENEEQKS
jgi:dTDP-glucose 4,6-dehydratase